MKKYIILGLTLAVLILPLMSSAQPAGPAECCQAHQKFTAPNGQVIEKGEWIGKSGGYCPATTSLAYAGDDWGIVCLLNTTINVTNWVFYIMMIISVLFVIVGGFLYMTSGGDPDKAGKGRQMITYAMIGIVIALLARVIPAIVRFIV